MTATHAHVVRRRGSVLIVTLGILIVLTSLVLLLARSSRTESAAAANHAAKLRADAIARGAIEYVRAAIADSKGTLPDDSAIDAEAVQIGDGYFWLIKRNYEDNATQTIYGITDEAGKLNVNSASAAVLSKLPNMTTEIAAAIVDWRDADDTPGSGGAESSYYLTLPTPYQAKNAPFESVDELLMVKDITPEVLYGNDLNRNGFADAQDRSADEGEQPLTQLDRGLVAYVTAFSSEPNTDSTGARRRNVNDPQVQLMPVLSDSVSGDRLGRVFAAARTGRPFLSTLDFYYRTGLTLDEFRKIEDKITTTGSATLTGLVNVNSAPREVLAALPQLIEADADAIIARRESDGGITDLATLTEVLARDKAIAVGATVTTKSYRCSIDVLAVDGTGRAFKRYQVVFNTQTNPVKIVYIQDITSLGWPLDPGILTNLRNGVAPSGAGSTMTAGASAKQTGGN